jgi:hypothetical protein
MLKLDHLKFEGGRGSDYLNWLSVSDGKGSPQRLVTPYDFT